MRVTSALFVLLAIIATQPHHALACICVYYELPVCLEYAKSEVVFVGRVRQIKKGDASDLVCFDVQEVFKGISGRTVELVSGATSCEDDKDFERGKTYLVFAFKDWEGSYLRYSECSRTQELTHAAADIAYIRGLAQGPGRPAILGRVAFDWKLTPLADVKIDVEGNGKTYSAVTNEEGRFSIYVDRPGRYTVLASAPRGAAIVANDPFGSSIQSDKDNSRAAFASEVTLEGCGYVEFDVHFLADGR